MVCYKIRITGKVQGVAFRYYSRLKANEIGVFGTTKNQLDGSVISIAYGELSKVNQFINWCHEGSPASSVDQVEYHEIEKSKCKEYSDFRILR